MRYIILSLLIISNMAMAGSWLPISKYDGNTHKGIKIFLSQKKCQKHFSEKCVEMPFKYNPSYHKLKDELIDDFSNPEWGTRSMVEPCSGESDCREKATSKSCAGNRKPYYNAEYSETCCNEILSYAKKPSGRKIVVEDEAKKTSYEAIEAAKKMDKMAMAIASKALDCGKKVISRMLLQNKPKNLKKAQVRNLVKTYKDIKNLLDTGSLESAREDILAVAINEPIVTQADKDALVAELDKCKP
jgi:hypothetical protein